jgi:hypothetical protein
VVVVLVDEHDVGVRVLQLLDGADAGEAAAEDDDARALWTGVRGVAHGAGTLSTVVIASKFTTAVTLTNRCSSFGVPTRDC